MKKKWNKSAQFERALAILLAAVLILQAVPMQSAISMTASASEITEESRESSGSEKSEDKDSAKETKKSDSEKEGAGETSSESSTGEEKKDETSAGNDAQEGTASGSSSSEEKKDDAGSESGKNDQNTSPEENRDKENAADTGNSDPLGENTSSGSENSGGTGVSGGEGNQKKDSETNNTSASEQGDTSVNTSGNTNTGSEGNTGSGNESETFGKTESGSDTKPEVGDNTGGDKENEQNPADEQNQEEENGKPAVVSDNVSPVVDLIPKAGSKDEEELLHVNDSMEFELSITDTDQLEDETLQYQAYVYKEGDSEEAGKELSARTEYSDGISFNKSDLENAGLSIEDNERYVIDVVAWDSAENDGTGSITFEYNEKVTGTISVEKNENVKEYSPEGQNIIYYDGNVRVTYSASHSGNYETAYNRDEKTIPANMKKQHTVTLSDSDSSDNIHYVYNAFSITGKDYAGNEILVADADKPARDIVIDQKAPEIKWKVEDVPALSIGDRNKGLSYVITIDDHNGSGINDEQLYFYIGDQGTTEDTVIRNDKSIAWTQIKGMGGFLDGTSLTFTLSDKKGKLFVKVCDRLGNQAIKLVNSLVVEDRDPEIMVNVKAGNEAILEFASDQDNKKSNLVTEYYNNLNVNLSITEKPDNGDRKGYSGISSVSWALIYSVDEDTSPDEAARHTVFQQKAPENLDSLLDKNNDYYSKSIPITFEQLTDDLKALGQTSGQYDLYVWAEDFCGNGETPVVIPLLFDITPPTVTVNMSNGVAQDGEFYYTSKNDTVSVTAADDRDNNLQSLSVTLKGEEEDESVSGYSKEIKGSGSISFEPEELKNYFGDSEQRISIKVESKDKQGNMTNLIIKKEESGVKYTDSATAGYAASAEFIRDAVSPVVTLVETKPSSSVYYKDDNSFYYNARNGFEIIYSIKERFFDINKLSASCLELKNLNAETESGAFSEDNENNCKLLFTEDGKYTDVTLSGTDIAGNEIVCDSNLVPCDPIANNHNENEIKDTSSKINKSPDNSIQIENQGNGVILAHPRILDRVSPVATIEHIIPDNTTEYLYPEKENGSTATMYSNHAVKTTIQVNDTYGGYGESGTPVLLDGEKLFVKKHFRKAGESFAVSDAESWAKEPGSTDALETEITTTQEGRCTFSISGTDRAGNPVVVNESLITNDKTKATVDTSKCDATPGTDIPTAENNPYKSFYALVYDCTAPVYRLTINNPANLEETFDEKTSIAYYGKSVSAINAKYVVTDYNFDDTRINAGITSESASGVNNMDSLSPSWTKPDTKGSAKMDKDTEVTTATFNLTVSVDGQHEGIHRFEIEGCDKAGNFLAQSSEQVTVDNSTKRADLAAKTVAQDASKGKFWTQRKAVDVSAPKGVLKVRSSKDSKNNYYHYKFDPGQNTPVMYEPFRKETSAYVIVESDDCSPTIVQYNLRSQDGSKDAEYKKKNPLVSAGNNGYKNDNTRDVTVNGEQAFYLENIIIKDRAGNVRANDSKSKYTMARSNNVYLDVTTPLVSDIKDAESPQVKIVASNSFTRHEADGERYIYKPDGSALDLKVSINDPGGKERSSGLQKVEVEVKVGGKVVTEKVSLGKIPYTYNKGSSDSHAPLVYDINDASISIPTGSFAESNDITITVTAWDNSGNKSTPSKDGGLLNLGIDTTAPTAIVTYQDTVQPQHDKYFKADRVVEIAIYDRNVDNGKINISTNTNVPGSFTAPHENKTTDGGDDGNKDKWTKTLHYDVDGDYTLQLSGTDALGNKLTDIKWNGPAPNEFTVDKTQPVIRINLSTEVNSQDGVKYYDSAATASIEIQEHNFFEETDPSLLNVTIEPTNHSGAEAPASPGRSAFSNSGTDMHVSTVDCTQDGDYEVTASYTDMAGNQAVVQGGEGKKSDQEAWSGKFVIDTVVPTLKMDPTTFNVDKATGDPLKDLADQIYTRKDFAPRVIINDINYDEANSNFEVKAYGANVRNEDLTEKTGDAGKGEYNIQFKNFEMVRDMDGVYKVTAVATDLAKHQATLDFLFSVNRFGSTYVYADEATESKVTRYYIKDTEEPLKILELSPVELKTHTAELFKDHNRNTLAEDTQYTFNPAKGSTSVGTNGEGHRVYEYTIAPEVYEEEGVYDFILSSTDAAGNENSTTLFRDGSVKDGEIEQVRFPINFQVDKTVPVNRLTGVESDKEQFNTDQLEIMVYPEDYQTDIGEVEVKIWDGSKNGANAQENKEKYLHYRTIREDEDVQKLAQEHVYPIEDAKAGIPVTLEDKGSWQLLEVITTDLAGNKSTDYRTEDLSVNIIESRRPFLVTTNPLIQFYNFKPALYGTTGGIVLLLFLLFFRKRRKEEKKGGEAA